MAVEEITIQWIALSTFRTTDPRTIHTWLRLLGRVLKLVLEELRQLEHINNGYMDDFWLQGEFTSFTVMPMF